MATDLQPPGSPAVNTAAQPLTAAAAAGAPVADNPGAGPTLAPKRQRRPSVRLGDIGDQPAATARTTSKQPWRLNPNPSPNPNYNINSNRSSKTRPLTNLVTSGNGDFSADANNNTHNGILIRKLASKSRRTTTGAKRVRPNFETDEERENGGNTTHNNFDAHDADDEEDDDGGGEGFRDFDPEGSDNHSNDDVAVVDAWHAHNRRSARSAGGGSTRVSDSHQDLGFDSRLDDGVRNWLLGLGLGRYASLFEIHEVDDEVLPCLTLDDLRDMGINAVGSRRKLFSAIQKLRKGLS